MGVGVRKALLVVPPSRPTDGDLVAGAVDLRKARHEGRIDGSGFIDWPHHVE